MLLACSSKDLCWVLCYLVLLYWQSKLIECLESQKEQGLLDCNRVDMFLPMGEYFELLISLSLLHTSKHVFHCTKTLQFLCTFSCSLGTCICFTQKKFKSVCLNCAANIWHQIGRTRHRLSNCGFMILGGYLGENFVKLKKIIK